MKESRHYKINGRIFKLSDVKKLTFFLKKEFKTSKRNKHHSLLNFSIICSDESKYESEDTNIFEENSVNSKKVERINLSFHDYHNDRDIGIQLISGEHSYGNAVEISGKDSNWVNGCLTKIKEIIEGAEPQFTLLKKLNLLLTILSSMSVGTAFLFVLVAVGRSVVGKSFISPYMLIIDEPRIYLTSIFVMGYFPSIFIIGWLNKMFPNIELQIGPTHTFIEANRRTILYGAITLIVLPIILAMIVK